MESEERPHFDEKDVTGKMYRFIWVMTGSGCHAVVNDHILTARHVVLFAPVAARIATEYAVANVDTLVPLYLVTDHTMKSFASRLVADDEKSDLAILRALSKNKRNFGPPLPLSSSDVERYESIFTIGTPDGAPFTVTDGFVNTLLVTLPAPFGDRMQLTLPIAGGNSGGCVFRMSTGEIVGVVGARKEKVPHVSYSTTLPAIRKFLESNLPKTAPETNGGHEAK